MQKRLFGILASIAVIAAACGGATTSSAPTAPAASTRPRRPVRGAGREPRPRARRTSPTDQILKIDLGQEPATLDPNKAQDSDIDIAVLHALNRGLSIFDKDLKRRPGAGERPCRPSRRTPRP